MTGDAEAGGPDGVDRPASGGTDRPWEVVLFDLDGTLADTVELILRSDRHTMETHLGEAPPDEAWLRTIGRPLRDALAEFARDADEAAAMLGTYETFQRSVHDRMVRPYGGVVDVVERVARGGTGLGLVTSKRREMALRTLEVCGLADAFRAVVTADDVERGKPDPEPVRAALERLRVPSADARVLFVGDSPFDLAAGKAAGVKSCAVLWGPFAREALEEEAPDYVVETVAELEAVLFPAG